MKWDMIHVQSNTGDTAGAPETKVVNGSVISSLLKAGKTPEQVIDSIYIRCLTRKPTEKEATILLGLLKQQMERFTKGGYPWELAASDPKNPPKLPQGVTAAQAAAWTVVSRVLLNLDEMFAKR